MKILIGTKNPGKIKGTKQAFEKYFENIDIEGISVDSEVGEQPLNEKIYQGAKNRVKNLKKYAKENNINVDYFVALEAGITNLLGNWVNINIAYIENKQGLNSMGISQGYPIPNKYIEEIKNTNLQNVVDKLFNEENLGQKNGVINILTKGEITRTDLNKNAIIMALTTFINGTDWRD